MKIAVYLIPVHRPLFICDTLNYCENIYTFLGVGSARKAILVSYLKFFSVYFQFLENPDKIKVHLYLPSVLFCPLCHWSQCAKNVMSDNPALEDFIIRLMDTLLCLPNRLRKVFGVNIWRNSIHGYDVFGNIMFGSQRQDWKNVPIFCGSRHLELFLRGSWLQVGLQCVQRATATLHEIQLRSATHYENPNLNTTECTGKYTRYV